MNKGIVGLAAILMLPTAQVSATLLLYDGFEPQVPDTGTYNYRPGELLAYSPDPDLNSNPNGQHNLAYDQYWRRAAAATGGNTVGIASGSLSMPGLPASAGNKAQFDWTQATSITRITVPGGPIANDTTWYWSGILNVSNIATLNNTNNGTGGGIILAGFLQGTGASTSTPTIFPGSLSIAKNANNSNQYFLGSGVTNGGIAFASTALNDGDNVFVVVAYDKVTGSNQDKVHLWINPDSSTFGGSAPAALVDQGFVSGTEQTPASFSLRNLAVPATGGTPMLQFDELRIGTTWADVTSAPVPEPMGLCVLGLGGMGPLARRRRRD